jgi:glycine/D-amino acid oxidase-like deaminating enzyme
MSLKSTIYDYIVIGAGIAGCSATFFLNQKDSNSKILIIEQNSKNDNNASMAAGAFLSPLVGKPNIFKDLVNTALDFSIKFYKHHTPQYIKQKGVLRIPKNQEDRDKFISYEPYMPYSYKIKDDGYFFDVGAIVDSKAILDYLIQDIEQLIDYKVVNIKYQDNLWHINNELKCKKLILSTGFDTSLLDEEYLRLRPVWGQRIIISTSTNLSHNYHKHCSISPTLNEIDGKNIISIGASHHRFETNKQINDEDTKQLLQYANDITPLKDIELLSAIAGVRASSIDYLPIVGKVIDSFKTYNEFQYMRNGTHVNSKRFTRYENLYILNGVGGRGFVLSLYLANMLTDNIIYDTPIDESIQTDRLFRRWVKRFAD